MKNNFLLAFAVMFAASALLASERPANSDVAVEDSFDREELGKEWTVNTGDWKIVDGVLRVREIPSQKHSAAARRVVETKNAVYEVKFRFVNAGKAFHLGFDPAEVEIGQG